MEWSWWFRVESYNSIQFRKWVQACVYTHHRSDHVRNKNTAGELAQCGQKINCCMLYKLHYVTYLSQTLRIYTDLCTLLDLLEFNFGGEKLNWNVSGIVSCTPPPSPPPPPPPAEKVWWFECDFLSLTPFPSGI